MKRLQGADAFVYAGNGVFRSLQDCLRGQELRVNISQLLQMRKIHFVRNRLKINSQPLVFLSHIQLAASHLDM